MSAAPRRHSPAVYRRRRLVVVLVLLVVVGAVVGLFVWQPWAAGAQSDDASAPAPASTASPAPTPVETTVPTPAPTDADAEGDADAHGEVPAVPDAGGDAIPPCTRSAVDVAAVVDQESYDPEELPELSLALTNTGEAACLLNVGTSTQRFTISTETDLWWRSTDCQTESSDMVVQLEPGQTVASAAPIVWDRTRSSVATCADDERPPAPSGWYRLDVAIGGLSGDAPATIILR